MTGSPPRTLRSAAPPSPPRSPQGPGSSEESGDIEPLIEAVGEGSGPSDESEEDQTNFDPRYSWADRLKADAAKTGAPSAGAASSGAASAGAASSGAASSGGASSGAASSGVFSQAAVPPAAGIFSKVPSSPSITDSSPDLVQPQVVLPDPGAQRFSSTASSPSLPIGPLQRLRRDLIIREKAQGKMRAFELLDPLTRRMIALYPAEMTIARELDGSRDLFALLAVARERGLGVSPAKLWKFVSVLQKSGFLEDPDAAGLGRNEFSVMMALPTDPGEAARPEDFQADWANEQQRLYQLALSLHRQGRLAEAEGNLNTLLDMNPGHTEARVLLDLVRQEKPGTAMVPHGGGAMHVRDDSQPSSLAAASLFDSMRPAAPADEPPNPLVAHLASLKIQRDEVKPPSRLWKILLTLVILGAIGAGVAFFLVPNVQSRIFKTQVRFTEVGMISPVEASIELAATGYVVPQTFARVSAKVTARIAKVLVKEGQMITLNQELVELDSSDLEAALATGRAKVLTASAKAAAVRASAHAASNLARREEDLVREGVRPRSGLEELRGKAHESQAQAAAAAAEVRGARAEVEALELSLRQATILAPIAGMILAVDRTDEPARIAEVGELVGPGQTDILEIADLNTLVVETEIPEARISMIRPGSSCEIILEAFPDRRFRGRTLEIGRRVARDTATITVKIAFVDPMTGVLPDMSAKVSFVTGELTATQLQAPSKLVVASNAIVTRNGQTFVFVVNAERAQLVAVRVGARIGEQVELLSGPREGTRVVASPPPDLQDGQPLKEKTD